MPGKSGLLKQIGPPLKATASSPEGKFNGVSGLCAAAVWPFLPDSFRQNEYALPAVVAWFSLGNLALQYVIQRKLFWPFRQENPADVRDLQARSQQRP